MLTTLSTVATGIPSPSQGVWWLGPIPLRAYGIIIVTGMIIAVLISRKRYAARGGDGEMLFDLAMWMLPLSIIGARIYHVLANAHYYFASAERMWEIPRIWEGGIAIWGGILAGALVVVVFMRRHGQRIGPMADAIAPTILLAQALGRWGNYFNQELFGSPTTLPWGLRIDDAHLPPGYAPGTLFHPTFLYESLWNLAAFFVIIWLDKRHSFKGGQVMCLYLMAYGPIRVLMETLRLDPAYEFLGIRQNAWMSIIAVIFAVIMFIYLGRNGQPTTLTAPERERAQATIDARQGTSSTHTAEPTTDLTTHDTTDPTDDQPSPDAQNEAAPASSTTNDVQGHGRENA